MGFSLQAHRRIAMFFFRAGFDPEQHIEKCSPVPLGDKMWARLVFKPGHAQQPTAIAPGDPETHYRHVGGHCTDSIGALCVLQERRVRRMHHAGVYCQGHNDIKHFEALKWIMGKAAGISKNVTDVMMEIHAVGATVSVRGGGGSGGRSAFTRRTHHSLSEWSPLGFPGGASAFPGDLAVRGLHRGRLYGPDR